MQTETPGIPIFTSTPIGAFQSGKYHDLFQEGFGTTDAEAQDKLDTAWIQLFYGGDSIY